MILTLVEICIVKSGKFDYKKKQPGGSNSHETGVGRCKTKRNGYEEYLMKSAHHATALSVVVTAEMTTVVYGGSHELWD